MSEIQTAPDKFLVPVSEPADIITRASAKNEEVETLVRSLKVLFPEVDLPIKHYQCAGIYGREMFAPAGTVIIGKIHLHDTLSFLLRGSMIIYSSGEGSRRYDAPATILAPAGTRRVLVAVTDSTFTAVLGTNERNIDVIESTCFFGTLDELKLALGEK